MLLLAGAGDPRPRCPMLGVAQHGMGDHLPHYGEPSMSRSCSQQGLGRLGEEFPSVAVKRASPHASAEQEYSEMTGFFSKVLVCLLSLPPQAEEHSLH